MLHYVKLMYIVLFIVTLYYIIFLVRIRRYVSFCIVFVMQQICIFMLFNASLRYFTLSYVTMCWVDLCDNNICGRAGLVALVFIPERS